MIPTDALGTAAKMSEPRTRGDDPSRAKGKAGELE